MNNNISLYLTILTCITVSLTANDVVAYRDAVLIAQAPAPAITKAEIQTMIQYAPNLDNLGLSAPQRDQVLKAYVQEYRSTIEKYPGNTALALSFGHDVAGTQLQNIATALPTNNISQKAALQAASQGEQSVMTGFYSLATQKVNNASTTQATAIMKGGASAEQAYNLQVNHYYSSDSKRAQTLAKIQTASTYTSPLSAREQRRHTRALSQKPQHQKPQPSKK